MAEWLRNPEVKLQTGIHGVLLVTAAAAAAIIWDIGCRHLSGGQRNIPLVYRKTI